MCIIQCVIQHCSVVFSIIKHCEFSDIKELVDQVFSDRQLAHGIAVGTTKPFFIVKSKITQKRRGLLLRAISQKYREKFSVVASFRSMATNIVNSCSKCGGLECPLQQTERLLS